MVYQNRFVAAIKVNGQVLRESGDSVRIPFGSEYSVFLKNLNSVRIKIKVSVDGQDATEATWLVIYPNCELELERFIRAGNWSSGNRFKFIERSKEIERHRGIKAEDGLIRIEYKTERVDKPVMAYGRRPINLFNSGSKPDGLMRQVRPANDVGITVPGSVSDQKFYLAEWFPVIEPGDVLVLRLRGELGGKKIAKPITVKTKFSCEICGHRNKATADFCSHCGTAMVFV